MAISNKILYKIINTQSGKNLDIFYYYEGSNTQQQVVNTVLKNDGYTEWTIVGGNPPWQSSKSSLTTISFNGHDASDARFTRTDMISPRYCNTWFKGCANLQSLDLTYLDTSNVTDMYAMFQDCKVLTSLDLSNFNTSNVTDMSYMFQYCQALTSLNVSNFDTSNVTNMSYMFQNCQALTSLNVSNFNTSNVTKMNSMFSNCLALTPLSVSNFNTSNVTDMSFMFYYCQALTSLNVSNFDTSNVTDMSYMFQDCQALTSLNVSNFNTSNVTNMNAMFSNCQALTSLNVSNFDTSNVTSMSFMFSVCKVLTSLDLSNFNTSNVTKMNSMFNNCLALTSLNVSNFNTSNVTNMSYMFNNCLALTSLNVSNFNTSNVTKMNSMFSNCSALTSLSVSNFNTSNVTDMSFMFYYCQALTSLNVSNFDTSNVTDMKSMFRNCQALTSLNVSNFDTSNVTDMSYMFYYCEELILDFKIDNNPTQKTDMFAGTAQPIMIYGSSSILNEIAATSSIGNVKVWSLNSNLTVERNDNDGTVGGITLDISRVRGNNESVTLALYLNNSLITPTWYDGSTALTGQTVIMNTETKTLTAVLNNLDESTKYDFRIEVSDNFGNAAPKYATMATAYYTIDFLEGGKSISFGEKADQDDLFELLITEPSDWSTNWANYYKIVNGEYVVVPGSSAPTFAADTYYKKVHDSLFKCVMDTEFEDMSVSEVSDFLSELDISGAGLNTTQADWVVESGTDGTWSWQKWQSGIVDLWGRLVLTLTNYATVNSWYGYNTGEQSLPFTVYSPVTQISAKVGSGFAHSGNAYYVADKTSISAITAYAIANQSGSQTTIWHINIKGRWK